MTTKLELNIPMDKLMEEVGKEICSKIKAGTIHSLSQMQKSIKDEVSLCLIKKIEAHSNFNPSEGNQSLSKIKETDAYQAIVGNLTSTIWETLKTSPSFPEGEKGFRDLSAMELDIARMKTSLDSLAMEERDFELQTEKANKLLKTMDHLKNQILIDGEGTSNLYDSVMQSTFDHIKEIKNHLASSDELSKASKHVSETVEKHYQERQKMKNFSYLEVNNSLINPENTLRSMRDQLHKAGKNLIKLQKEASGLVNINTPAKAVYFMNKIDPYLNYLYESNDVIYTARSFITILEKDISKRPNNEKRNIKSLRSLIKKLNTKMDRMGEMVDHIIERAKLLLSSTNLDLIELANVEKAAIGNDEKSNSIDSWVDFSKESNENFKTKKSDDDYKEKKENLEQKFLEFEKKYNESKKEDEKILGEMKKSEETIRKCEEMLKKIDYLEDRLRNDDSCSLDVKEQLDEISEFSKQNGIDPEDLRGIRKNKLH